MQNQTYFLSSNLALLLIITAVIIVIN